MLLSPTRPYTLAHPLSNVHLPLYPEMSSTMRHAHMGMSNCQCPYTPCWRTRPSEFSPTTSSDVCYSSCDLVDGPTPTLLRCAATILRVFALLHSVIRLSAQHCRLVPAGHAVDPDLSEFSNRPQSLHVTRTHFADPQAMPSCPHVSAQALCLDSLTYGSNAFEFACLLSFLALYKRLYVVSSVHCAMALHSACRLFSLRSVPPPAHTLLLDAPQPMDTTHTMLNTLHLSAIRTINYLVLTSCNIRFFLAWFLMVFASLRTRRTAAYAVPGPATGRPLPPTPQLEHAWLHTTHLLTVP